MSGETDNHDFIKHKLSVGTNGSVVDADSYVFDFSDETIPVLVKGNPDQSEQPLTRIQSRCIYSQVFGSKECDCQAQLEAARQRIIEANTGIFIFLDQEGRGAGLANKARVYKMCQQEDTNTVEAYQRLGLEVDSRSYDHAVKVLEMLGVNSIRLLTNNPAKKKVFSEAGFDVERVPLRIDPSPQNIEYLKVKQAKLGHDLDINEDAG